MLVLFERVKLLLVTCYLRDLFRPLVLRHWLSPVLPFSACIIIIAKDSNIEANPDQRLLFMAISFILQTVTTI